ncbi:BON domain-containing protein [Hymenobacter persicinus]|uniref:BON domain-containing protein n=1 Tax=Hymenobacter persicinus TaxID=2025506 RepID=A0A4V1ZAK5_9BACT|nr:BON domain-containing protein [Hymenobacter persicinus]RYU78530.1 BON domain-containing protein [Hymenobacter persicinus]
MHLGLVQLLTRRGPGSLFFPPSTFCPCSLNPPPATEDRLADADITAAITQLLLRQGIRANLIRLRCQQGIVELVGFTDNLLTLHRAEEIATAVRGGRAVVNALLSARGPRDADRDCAAAEAYACGAREVNNHLRRPATP